MAAGLNIQSNLSDVVAGIRAKIDVLKNPEYLFRPVCFDLIDLMTQRIHERGIASDGSPIGTYTKGYMATRVNKYKRTKDTKVIISLTRQLESDWSVIATPNGYGIGFKNSHNFDKSQWVEATYGKKIFSLSASEEEYARESIQIQIQNALAGGQPGNQ